MGLEAASFIDGLVATNPTGTDTKGQGDDHIRLIKAVLKASFPTVAGPVSFGGWHLKTDAVNPQTGAYTLQTTDDGKIIPFTLASGATLGLLPAATAGAGFVCWVQKDAGNLADLTIDPDGAELVNGQTTIGLTGHEGGLLYCTGTAWLFVGMASSLPTGTRRVTRNQNDASTLNGLLLQRRRGNTPAAGQANDFGTAVAWSMWDNAGTPAEVAVANIRPKLLDPTAGSVDAEHRFATIDAGVLSDKVAIYKGIRGTSLTDTGLETANFLGYYVNGIRGESPELLTKTAAYDPTADDLGKIIRWTTAGSTTNLPTAVGRAGARLTLWNDAAAGDITIDPDGGQALDGFATRLLRAGDRVTIVSDGSNWRTWRGRYSFKSSELAVDNAHADAVAHGIGEVPNRWRLILRNKTTEHNYAVGDELIVGGDYADQASSAAGVGVAMNATNVYLLQATIQYKVLDRTTPGTAQTITAANWKFEVEVWKEY